MTKSRIGDVVVYNEVGKYSWDQGVIFGVVTDPDSSTFEDRRDCVYLLYSGYHGYNESIVGTTVHWHGKDWLPYKSFKKRYIKGGDIDDTPKSVKTVIHNPKVNNC